MTAYEIMIPVIALGLGVGAVFIARLSAHRLERQNTARPPAE